MGKFKLTVCGGTFDLFHAGHKAFIRNVLNQSEKVVLGITSDSYVKSFKDGNNIESFELRRKAVQDFLDSIGASDKVQLVEINNAYEPYLETSLDYQAIVVTEQTKQAAIEINSKRKQNGILELEIIISPIKQAEDGGVISSSRIRNGEINRDGRLNLNPRWQNKILVLPENLRSTLQQPWGEVLKEVPDGIDGSKTIAIGDITVQKFNQRNVGQFLSIVDFLVQRQVKFHEFSELGLAAQNVQKVNNPHGTTTPELFRAIEEAFKMAGEQAILVEGEEDLAVLPVLLISPLGFSAFYGQPNEGLVRIEVTEANKEKAYRMADSFDKSERI